MPPLRYFLMAALFQVTVEVGLAQTPGVTSRAEDAQERATAATVAPSASPAASDHTSALFGRSCADWQAACARLPSNRSLRGGLPRRELLPLPRFRDFEAVLAAFFAVCKSGSMAQNNHWVAKPPATAFFNTATAYFVNSGAFSSSPAIPFEPFVQKQLVPEGSEVFFHADFHGDIRSLLADVTWLNDHRYLRDFSIARTNFYLVFLGDYTDRGAYGVEVLYTLLRLKVANPDQVFLLRGNHEEIALQARYGFLDEGRAKYSADFNGTKVLRAYDFLPVALYLGCGENFVQCNHGGIEPGFDPQPLLEDSGSIGFQLLGSLSQLQYLTRHPDWFAKTDTASLKAAHDAFLDFRPIDPISPSVIGFIWNDFSIAGPGLAVDPRRGFVYGQSASEFFLHHAGTETKHLQAIFRGHQHSAVLDPMMSRLLASRGVFRYWQKGDSPALLDAPIRELAKVLEHGDERTVPSGSVWTLNVSPDSVYGIGCNYDFDSFGILKLARNFPDWRLQVVNLPVKP